MAPPNDNRFWSKVDFSRGKSACWLWTAALDTGGYGSFNLLGTTTSAHRIAWEVANGPIPDDMDVLHRCDNRRCVNPRHLFLGTHTDNMRDALSKNRLVPHRGSKNGFSKLCERDIPKIRSMISDGMTLKEIGDSFGVSLTTIWQIKRGKTWQHVKD